MSSATSMRSGFVAQREARVDDTANAFGERRLLHYFVEGGEPGTPEGYLVWVPPGNVVNPHFHRLDQYQIFFGAEGATYQRIPLEHGAVLVHYTDAFTTYGPFQTTVKPMEFYTLRGGTDRFTGYMPGDRGLRRPGHGRRVERTLDLSRPMPGPGEIEYDVVIDRTEDGLTCCLISAGPEAAVTVPEPAGSGGQYLCLLSGAASTGPQPAERHALAWVGPQDEPLRYVAGPTGCRVVVLQLPVPTAVAEAPGSER